MLLVQIYGPRVFPEIFSELPEVTINYGRKNIGLCCKDRRHRSFERRLQMHKKICT